jgi:pimeloyl-ACP methyl ester carboxylesterase
MVRRFLVPGLFLLVVHNAMAIEPVRQDAANETAVVFVHGIFGNRIETWTSKSSAAYWPRMLVTDQRFDGANIYTAEYRSRMWERGLDVEQTAQQLHWTLQPILASHKSVVFVCHSLGGIVVREYLLQFRIAPEKVPMIYFFGTPSEGAEIAVWAKLVSPNAQLSQLSGGNRSYLDKLGDRWINGGYAGPVKSFCAYEDPSRFPNVVDPQSAKFGCNSGVFPLLENHSGIVKPRDTDAAPHRALATAYREVIHNGAPPPFAIAATALVPAETPESYWDRIITAYNSERPRPPGTISAGAACRGAKPVILFSTSEVKGATHYIIHRNGIETFHTREPRYFDESVVGGMPYTYFAQACDAGGCGPATPFKATATAVARCHNKVPACTSIDTQIAGSVVNFSARATDDDGDRLGVLWNFGDSRQLYGTTSLRHTYASPGTYNVTATLDDALGGIATCSRQVTVRGKALTAETANEAWIAEETAQLRPGTVTATPPAGLETTRFVFRADVPEQYGRPVRYRWNFSDNGTPGGEWSSRSSSREISHVFKIYQDVAHESVRLEVTFDDGRVVELGGTSVVVRREVPRDGIVSSARSE